MKRVFIIFTLLCMLCGCSAEKPSQNEKISVVTTIFPIYDFVRAVGAERIDCRMLIDPGTEVHTFDPTPSDLRAVYNADLVIYIGGESDKWVNSMLADVNVNSLSLLPEVEAICEENHTHHSHSHKHGADEHIWTSMSNACLMVDTVALELSEIDPQNADYYNKNALKYKDKINDLSKEMSALVESQEEPFILVADRFPFLYLTEEFGISYEAAFGGCAVSTDISLKTMKRLVERVKDKGVTHIYCTEMSSENIARAVSEETGAEILQLHSAHNVTLDDYKSGITYLDIMEKNIDALKEGWGN